MKIDLSKEQIKYIGQQWVKNQQNEPEGYKDVLNILFTGGHFAKWSWMKALDHAVSTCSKAYCSKTDWIVLNLKRHGDSE